MKGGQDLAALAAPKPNYTATIMARDAGQNNNHPDWPASILPRHRQDLAASGITPETAIRNGIYSVSDPETIARLLNWKTGQKRDPKPIREMGACLVFPYHDATGKPTGYHRLKPDHPRTKNGRTLKYEAPLGQPNRPYFPIGVEQTIADSSATLYVTEGEKKSLAGCQSGFNFVGLSGVEAWSKKRSTKEKDSKAPRQLIDGLAAIPWQTRPVFLCFDSDAVSKPEIQCAECALAEALERSGATVLVVRIPEGPPGPDGKPLKLGLDDYLLMHGGNGAEQFRHLIANARPAEVRDSRPVIYWTADEHRHVRKVAVALVSCDGLYQRGNTLVRIQPSELPPECPHDRPPPRIVSLDLPAVQLLISEQVRVTRRKPKEVGYVEERIHVPPNLTKGVLSLGSWPGIPVLANVIESPVMLAGGSIIQEPGLHKASGLFYWETAPFPRVPERVTRDMALNALAAVLDPVSEFPFFGPAHRSSWLASVFAMAGRYAVSGPVPMNVVDSNVRGTGKGKLVDLASIIALGHELPKYAPLVEDEEMRKTLLGIAKDGDRAACFDNAVGIFGCPSLDSALTTGVVKGRLLKTNDNVEFPISTVFFATGNNVAVGSDTARRAMHTRLESTLENPETRTGFKYPDVIAHVKANRRSLLVAVLTVLRGYVQAGRPTFDLVPWGSFEGFAFVRNCLVWLGEADPARLTVESGADRAADGLRALLYGWSELPNGDKSPGLTVAAVLRLLAPTKDNHHPNDYQALRSALTDYFDCPAGQLPKGNKVGNRLRTLKGRVANGMRFESCTAHAGVMSWYVADAAAGIGGTGGTSEANSLNGYAEKSQTHTHTHAYTQGGGKEKVPPTPPVPPTEDGLGGTTVSSAGRCRQPGEDDPDDDLIDPGVDPWTREENERRAAHGLR
jgi:hypothetical protein